MQFVSGIDKVSAKDGIYRAPICRSCRVDLDSELGRKINALRIINSIRIINTLRNFALKFRDIRKKKNNPQLRNNGTQFLAVAPLVYNTNI